MSEGTLNGLVAILVGLTGLIAVFFVSVTNHDTVPTRLFPEAVEVRAFAWDYVAGGGEVQVVPDGVVLAKEEVAIVRRAIYWQRPPEAEAACCIPRHAFKFYDAEHAEIGSVEVCYECRCARIAGEGPPDTVHTDAGWDGGALASVLRAHKLPVDY
jgi:hypothetical protein